MPRSPKVAFVLALCLSASPQPAALAQQVKVGENVNVLPVSKSTPPGQPPGDDDYLRGDLFGQRQNEPSVAVSTVNKDHILAFYNDFRAVDLGTTEPPLPDDTRALLAKAWDGMNGFLTRLAGGTPPEPAPAMPERAAAAEAWIGMSASYDGGLTWVGGLVPGSPEDDSPASLASPAHGLLGASDPVVVSAPCGKFFLAWMAFTRGGESRLLVSRFTDLNDSDQRHTIRYEGTSVVEIGQNATNGHFVDKPHAAIELTGGTGCSAFNVHVSYTTFVGTGGFTSKITVASSKDGGLTFTRAQVDKCYNENQGTALVAHPTNRQVYVFWRSFDPNTIIMSKRSSTGVWSRPTDILAKQAPMVPFDQPALGAPSYVFRSNGFPTGAMTPDGKTILVAWHELWNGLPRIVVKQINTATGGGPARTAAATIQAASPPGLGFFSPSSTGAAGPQVMPKISCTVGNRCMLTYYEGRGSLTNDGWIGGVQRQVDLRGVVVTPGPQFSSSFQVSRYGYEPPTGLDGAVNQPVIDWLEDAIGGGLEADALTNASRICPPAPAGQASAAVDPQSCYASLNYSGYPHTGGGTVPFMGDYTDVQPVVPYVLKAGKWQVPTLASDVPYDAAFVAAWADNRNVVRPTVGGWSNYAPPGTGSTSCVNPGSRDQSVMTAQLSYGLLITAPTNYKPVANGAQVAFPMTVWNNTGADVTVDLALTGNATASFAKDPATSGEYVFPLKGGDLRIFAYSSSSIYVYVTNDPAPFTVTATVKPAPVPAVSAAMTFNAPAAASSGAYANQATVLTVAENPVPRNPVPRNPVPRNPVPRNPVPRNYPPEDGIPYTEIYGVKDYSVTVSADDAAPGDVGAYLALFNVDKAYKDSYVFQVFITKPTYAFEVVGECESQDRLLGTMVANISDPGNPVPRNPVPRNPVPRNPVPRNPAPSDALAQNSTFTLGSNEAGASGLRTASASPGCGTNGSGLIAECTKAAPRDPNQVVVTLRAYQVRADTAIFRRFDPYGEDGAATPPSLVVADSTCTDSSTDPNCTVIAVGPDLAVPDPPTAGVTPTTVNRGAPVLFPSSTVSVTNEGSEGSDPTEYKVGFYLSGATTIGGLPRNPDGTIKTDGTPYTKLLTAAEATGTTDVVPTSLTIPADTTVGTYYLYAYVDSERVVSELDEDNNIVQGGPITVIDEPPFQQDLVAARYRSFANTGGEEVYLGAPDLGAVPRGATNLAWTTGTSASPASNNVTVTYHPISGLTTTVTNGVGTSWTVTRTLDQLLADFTSKAKTNRLADLNVLRITVKSRNTGSNAALKNVVVNGQALGSFAGVGVLDWTVTGACLADGFTLTGKVQLDGPFSTSQELSAIDVRAGVDTSLPRASICGSGTPTVTPLPTSVP